MTSTRISSESPVIRNSSTVSDLIRRSAGRFPTDTALEFGDRTWTYAELDSAVTAVARELVRLGVTKGDRVAAYGKNSDLFVLLYLGCARAGFIHVPVNYQLKNDELDYILSNSGAEIVFSDSDLMSAVTSTPTGAEAQVIDFADLVPVATAEEIAPAGSAEFSVDDTDVAQLLYTSGTTSAPKGAVMTHRALLHEYLSSLMSLDFAATDRAVHALPLYHSAQMHVFLLPLLSIGAHNIIVPAPVPEQLLAIFEEREINSFFAAPTVWVALANSPDLDTRNLDSLHKAYYGASIMPGPILERLRQRLPLLGFYNCFGQSELGPLCTVLRPEEHDDHPGSTGRRSCAKAIGIVRKPPLKPSTTAGSIPATSSKWTRTASSKSSTGSRTSSTPVVSWSPAVRSRMRSSICPRSPKWPWSALPTRSGSRRSPPSSSSRTASLPCPPRMSSPTSNLVWRDSRCPREWSSWPNCRRTRPGRSSSAACAKPERRTLRHWRMRRCLRRVGG